MARLKLLVALAVLVLATPGCPRKPTMRLNHAEITGVRITFPPSLGILMTLVIDVHNPNSYDVAVRAVRGQVTMAQRYTMPVDFRAGPDGVWLPSDRTTSMRVDVIVPIDIALSVLRDSYASPIIPYRFVGRADVTATRTFQLESDDYEVNEQGSISREQIDAALRRAL
jgi:hypothetical protein